MADIYLSNIERQVKKAFQRKDPMLFADALDNAAFYGGFDGDAIIEDALELAAQKPMFLRKVWVAVADRWNPDYRVNSNMGWWFSDDEYQGIWTVVWKAVRNVAEDIVDEVPLPDGAPDVD